MTQEMLAPPWVDEDALCKLICVTPNTLRSWVAKGIIPPPKRRGFKDLWRWREVDEALTNGRHTDNITDAVKKALDENARH